MVICIDFRYFRQLQKMNILDIKSNNNHSIFNIYNFGSDIFGYQKYFTLGRVRFQFSKYQNFDTVQILTHFSFDLVLLFQNRIWFGSSDSYTLSILNFNALEITEYEHSKSMQYYLVRSHFSTSHDHVNVIIIN